MLSRWADWRSPCRHPIAQLGPRPGRLAGGGHGPHASATLSTGAARRPLSKQGLELQQEARSRLHLGPGLVSAAQMAGIGAEGCAGPMAEHLPDCNSLRGAGRLQQGPQVSAEGQVTRWFCGRVTVAHLAAVESC